QAARGRAFPVGDALRGLRHAVHPQHHAGAARLALGVARVEFERGVGDGRAARHRQIELLARVAVAEHHRLAYAQILQ
ncbi:hypothetical protein HMPREF0345_0458, partial [Enterococcus faecalis ATCC 29200]